jgi:hypothetical protein
MSDEGLNNAKNKLLKYRVKVQRINNKTKKWYFIVVQCYASFKRRNIIKTQTQLAKSVIIH